MENTSFSLKNLPIDIQFLILKQLHLTDLFVLLFVDKQHQATTKVFLENNKNVKYPFYLQHFSIMTKPFKQLSWSSINEVVLHNPESKETGKAGDFTPKGWLRVNLSYSELIHRFSFIKPNIETNSDLKQLSTNEIYFKEKITEKMTQYYVGVTSKDPSGNDIITNSYYDTTASFPCKK